MWVSVIAAWRSSISPMRAGSRCRRRTGGSGSRSTAKSTTSSSFASSSKPTAIASVRTLIRKSSWRWYAASGPACLEQLRGMFAFAIWDAQERSLFIARDRRERSRSTIGSTEMESRSPPSRRRFSRNPVSKQARTSPRSRGNLSYQYVPAPHSAFEGVSQPAARSLPPRQERRGLNRTLLATELRAKAGRRKPTPARRSARAA